MCSSPGSNAYLDQVRRKLKSQGTKTRTVRRRLLAPDSFGSVFNTSVSSPKNQGGDFDTLAFEKQQASWTNRSHLKTGGNQRHEVLRLDCAVNKGDHPLSPQHNLSQQPKAFDFEQSQMVSSVKSRQGLHTTRPSVVQ